VIIVFVIIAALAIPLPGEAATYSDLQKKNEQLEQQKKATQQQLSEVKSKTQDAFQALVELQSQIEKLEQQSSSLVQRRQLLEEQIATLDSQIKDLEKTIEEERANLEQTLVTMYKWQKVAPSALVLVINAGKFKIGITHGYGGVNALKKAWRRLRETVWIVWYLDTATHLIMKG